MNFELTQEAIEPTEIRHRAQDPVAGGYCAFEGWVRNHHLGREVLRLEYEAYEALALKEGQRVVDEAITRFGLTRCVCIHRTGALEIGDIAVMIAVSSPHRDEAFQACRYIIDEIKHRVPIWKKEFFKDGDSGWVRCDHCAGHHDHTGHGHHHHPH
jgi:molybdopterin synthase catalytic subunit